MSKTYAIILAAGSGKRFGNETPKQFIEIAGRSILERTLDIFEASKNIDAIILVIPEMHREQIASLLFNNTYTKIAQVVNGGSTRQESAYRGILAINEKDPATNVMIHDVARPFVTESIIQNCIDALKNYDAVTTAIPSSDTLVEINSQNEITLIPERALMRRVQTPQAFKLPLIKKAHVLSKDDSNFTDDCGLILKHHLSKIFVVEGDEKNIKITHPQDVL